MDRSSATHTHHDDIDYKERQRQEMMRRFPTPATLERNIEAADRKAVGIRSELAQLRKALSDLEPELRRAQQAKKEAEKAYAHFRGERGRLRSDLERLEREGVGSNRLREELELVMHGREPFFNPETNKLEYIGRRKHRTVSLVEDQLARRAEMEQHWR